MLILLPLQGVFFVCAHTQGVALGYKILALSGRFPMQAELIAACGLIDS